MINSRTSLVMNRRFLCLLLVCISLVLPCSALAKPKLSQLTCTNEGEIPKWNGTEWVCAPDDDTQLDAAGIEALVGPHTVDTSAADCEPGEYLDGDGSCKLVSTVSDGDIVYLMTLIENVYILQSRSASAYVFVSASETDGNLGGVEGANQICQSEADAAGLPGRYEAWIADSNPDSAPSNRFHHALSAYILPPGSASSALAVVAEDWTDLTDGSIATAIKVTASGIELADNPIIWTNVAPDGTQFSSVFSETCNDWTTGPGSETTARRGLTFFTDSLWTSGSTLNCSGAFASRLYCFGQ